MTFRRRVIPFLLLLLAFVPAVADIRGYGMLGGIELIPGEKPGRRGHEAYVRLYEAGLMTKATGDALLIAPPLVAEPSHIEMMAERLRTVLGAI